MYCIDFFVLINASSGIYFIMYLGKNATNAFIVAEVHNLLTMQKTVINAIVSSKIANEWNSIGEIYMDNRYSVPILFLFVLLQEKYNSIACGTVKTNCIGWVPQILNLPKSLQRGMSLVKFNPINRL